MKLPLVMLIDDSFIDNYVNQKIMEKYGFAEKIIEFKRASQALDYLKDPNNPLPSVIFLDLHMPVMNGYQFLAELDKIQPQIPLSVNVVILTSSIIPQHAVLSMGNKYVILFINKPLLKLNLDSVMEKIQEKNSDDLLSLAS